MIKIFTDSTSYIPDELIKKYSIGVLSLSVSLDGEEYVENQITNEEFFALMEQSREFPKSSQPSADEVYTAFKQETDQGNEVLGIFLSSKMSGTYSTACMVKDMVQNENPNASIALVDSESNCMQLGLIALAAAEAAFNGETLEQALNAAEEAIKRTRFIFVPKNLRYLEKGGRIGRAQALLGNALKLIPILTVNDGVTDSMAKVRTFTKAVERLLTILKEDIETLGVDKIVVSHINAIDQAKKLAERIKEFISIDVIISSIGPVIGSHVGPGAVGIIYRTLKPHPMNA